MLKCIFKVSNFSFLDSNENYMTMKIFRITAYISELKQGTNRSLVSFTSLVISSDNVN